MDKINYTSVFPDPSYSLFPLSNMKFILHHYLYDGLPNVHLCGITGELWQDGKKADAQEQIFCMMVSYTFSKPLTITYR